MIGPIYTVGRRAAVRMAAWGLISATVAVHAIERSEEPVALRGGEYVVDAQMVLPHLEEMRRTFEQHRICVTEARPGALFPVFEQPALIGCHLDERSRGVDEITYVLICRAVNGGSGSAVLRFRDGRINGTLKAKMGGKNMTFSQFVKAEWRAACPPKIAR